MGSQDGRSFTILTQSIYTVKWNWVESPKSSRWKSQKKAQLTVLCRDLKLMSQHEFPLIVPVQSQPYCSCCNQIPCIMLGSMVATSFVVPTLFAQCFSRIDVATTVSCRDIIVFLFSCLLSHNLSSESGLFSLLRYMSRLHFSVVTLLLFLLHYFRL